MRCLQRTPGDKTGALTKDRLSLGGALVQPGFTEDDLVRTAALASNAGASMRGLETPSLVPFSPLTHRTESIVDVRGRKAHAIEGALRTSAEPVGLPLAIGSSG